MTAAHQAPLSTGLFRQEYWSGLPFPSPFTSLRTCKHGELVTLAGPKGPGNPACLCHHAHRCVRLGDTTFYKNHRLCLIRPVGLWIPEDLKQVHMAPRVEEAARAQAAMAIGKPSAAQGALVQLRPRFLPKTQRLRAYPLRFSSVLWRKEEERRLKECLEFQLGSKHHCSQNLVNFSSRVTKRYPSKEGAVFKRQHQKWLTW